MQSLDRACPCFPQLRVPLFLSPRVLVLQDASEIAPQLKRLSGMTKDAKSLKPDLAQWIGQRIAILTQLESAAAAPVKDEV